MSKAIKNIIRLNKIANNSDVLTGVIGKDCSGAYSMPLSEIVSPVAEVNLMTPSILAINPESAKMNKAFKP